MAAPRIEPAKGASYLRAIAGHLLQVHHDV